MPNRDLWLTSGIQDSTQNRDKFKMPDITFKSKGELRQMIEPLYKDINKMYEELEKAKSENRFIRKELLDMQRVELERHRGAEAFMTVAI